jgi:simple sugar transport system permease protein
MESYALLLGSTLSAGTVLALAALGLLINENRASSTSAPKA